MVKNSKKEILKGKNCFLTGATGGIGKSIARKLAEDGCNLFLTSENEIELLNMKEELKNVKVAYESGDLNKVEDIESIIDKAKKEFGNIDILINCAGIFPVKSLQESTLEDFDNCFNVNIRAAFLFCKAFAESMVKNKWGRIVNIGSSSAYGGTQNTSLYCASKHAILGFSRALHQELKENSVRVFCVSPGGVKTEMGKKITWQDYNTLIDPEDIAEYVSFIISFDGDMVVDETRLNRMIIQ
ncbi:MAG: SDR family oxidoreductase [Candidatus Staskawiczbacteria bacterium]|nr:SDR family oxidoreductase [Candidatus Staskawiczbacteria bacterium]